MKFAPCWLGTPSETVHFRTARARNTASASEFILRYGVLRPNTYMQLAQLLLIHFTWRIRQQALRALGFGEGNHVTDGFGTGHQSHQAIQPKSQAAMRWCAVL